MLPTVGIRVSQTHIVEYPTVGQVRPIQTNKHCRVPPIGQVRPIQVPRDQDVYITEWKLGLGRGPCTTFHVSWIKHEMVLSVMV